MHMKEACTVIIILRTSNSSGHINYAFFLVLSETIS